MTKNRSIAEELQWRCKSCAVFSLVFYALYGTAALVSIHVPWRISVGFEWEKDIPFLPYTSIIYLSGIYLIVAALVAIKERRKIAEMFVVMSLQTLVACIVFILLPAVNNFPPRTHDGMPLVFLVSDWVNLWNNELPSLHVCLAVTSVGAMWSSINTFWRTFMIFWAISVGISTMTMHEHNLVDVIGGLLLGIAGLFAWHRLAQSKNFARFWM